MVWIFINSKSKLGGNNSTRVAKGEKKFVMFFYSEVA